MHITRLQITNYRNYARADVPFTPGVTVLHGDNAQGKTAVLEAIYLCCTGRSHRTSRDRELILWGEPQLKIILDLSRKDGTRRIEVILTETSRKQVKIDGTAISRSGELMGHLNGVLFSPEDLALIKNGPAERRRFIDMELSQIKPAYYYALQRYHRALTQRNALLRDAQSQPKLISTIDSWDEQLARAGAEIIAFRRNLIEKLNRVASSIHRDITSSQELLSAVYEPSLQQDATGAELESRFLGALGQARALDLRRMTTTVGPHRDDLKILINGIDARTFGSQGQQRTAALSLKLSELTVMRELTGEWPVLMLDDVMSELDPRRRKQLFSHLQDVQTIVTCTDASDLGGAEAAVMIHISGGEVQQ